MGNVSCSFPSFSKHHLEPATTKKNGKKNLVPNDQPVSSFADLKKLGFARKKQNKRQTFVPVAQPVVFPPEIIIEILSWLPAKVLIQPMCVCKHWYAVIHDRHFIQKHASRAAFTIVYNKIPKASYASAGETYQLICGCDGLRVEKNNSTQKYHIHNPETRQVYELPDPQKGSFGFAISYVPSARAYELVAIYAGIAEKSDECCQVLTVGIDKSWRPLKMSTVEATNKKRKKILVVSTASAVHCVLISEIGSNISQQVLSLDLETEDFTMTTLPRGMYQGWQKLWGLDWNGKLAIVDRMEQDFFVLVLEDYKKPKWGERKTLISSASMKSFEQMSGEIFPLTMQSDTLWFWMKDDKIFSYDIKNGRILRIISAPEGHTLSSKIFHFHQQSLASFKTDATSKPKAGSTKFKSGFLKLMDHIR